MRSEVACSSAETRQAVKEGSRYGTDTGQAGSKLYGEGSPLTEEALVTRSETNDEAALPSARLECSPVC